MIWKNLTKEQLEETKKHFSSKGYLLQCYGMAMEIILTTLGKEWWKSNCKSDSTNPTPFLQTNDYTESGRYEHQDRIIWFGHILFALKECNGFDIFIDKLKKRDFESAFFELWAAYVLKKNMMAINFFQETGKKGEDYDLLARKNEMIIYAEAKSRRNGLILNENTLINALSTARKQLPKSGPGVIFIWIPVEWTQDVEAEVVISRVIISFFRNTQRVNTVILLWESWFEVSKGKGKAIFVRQYDNPNPKTIINLGKFVQPIEIGRKIEVSSFTPSFW